METLDGYLNELSSASATPGGGSAAMFVAATGAALVGMVARISAANPRYAQQRETADRIAAAADVVRGRFIEARKRDEEAFERVIQAQRLPKSDDAERAARARTLETALQGAAAVPLELAGEATSAMALVRDALAIENPNLISDLGCAAEFLHAAVRACLYSVRINLKYMRDAQTVNSREARCKELEDEAAPLLAAIREAVGRGMVRT